MRVLLNLVLILVSFFACYTEDIYLCLLPPQKGSAIPMTIRTPRYFEFDQEKALGNKRDIALSQYVPLYTYSPDAAARAVDGLKELAEKIDAFAKAKSSGTKDLQEFIQGTYGLEWSPGVAKRLLRYRDLKNYIEGIVTVEESILQGKIVEDPQPLAQKKTIEVLYPKPSGIVILPAVEVMTVENARTELREKVQQLFWQVDKEVLEPVLAIALGTLRPNLKYDVGENNKRIDEIIHRYPSKVIPYGPGQILVPSREVLTENDLLLLSSYREEAVKDLWGKAPWVFIAILLTVCFYGLSLEKILKDEWRKPPPFRLFVCLLIITVVLSKACLLFTALPAFALPFSALPMLIFLLHRDKISATWTTLTAAVLVSLFSGRTLESLLFFAFAGIAAIMASSRLRKRYQILFPSLVAGATNSIIIASFTLNWAALLSLSSAQASESTQVFGQQLLGPLGWGFVGGLAAGPLALLLLPLLEMSWHTASTFRLNHYADLQHPLMKDLLTKTPATYQHTMTVAYLAQSVGEAIGANTLLLRIGAYYHDIGKMANPKLFAENQSNGRNPHDHLDPMESARIIIDHVRNGEKIGREMKLPQVVLDFITQHHGTQLVEYFYSKAVKNGGGNGVRKEDFQYPGPKPKSIEAAILMIADAVEAASRSLDSPTRETIENMVRVLLVKRIAEGQFDECHLSTRYLAKIMKTLVDSLEASFHSRVVYPWQEKQKEKLRLRQRAATG